MEAVGQIPVPELTFTGRECEELRQIVVIRDVLGLTVKLKNDKSPGVNGIYPRVSKELPCEIANLQNYVTFP